MIYVPVARAYHARGDSAERGSRLARTSELSTRAHPDTIPKRETELRDIVNDRGISVEIDRSLGRSRENSRERSRLPPAAGERERERVASRIYVLINHANERMTHGVDDTIRYPYSRLGIKYKTAIIV